MKKWSLSSPVHIWERKKKQKKKTRAEDEASQQEEGLKSSALSEKNRERVENLKDWYIKTSN